ncbi:DgyrCDS5154 [Dimorphilus gyrociliatus]|uniref:Septin n=1 Tax=Dimorphilus gyrociliatus TaxID=2664684 RepID=A0A7I8VIZ0_9ANNE|nr:DgyrCDS5154 [Dimorphilus gyrociliatus]
MCRFESIIAYRSRIFFAYFADSNSRVIRYLLLYSILHNTGETGIGKSTLMDTLFRKNFDTKPAAHNDNEVTLKEHRHDMQEKQVRLKLTIIDTVNFSDQIDKSESYKPIVKYIEDQFESYLQEELKVRRALHAYHDTRVHVCLYFIPPTGLTLKELDIATMKALEKRVNIIPIIAKADSITKPELLQFKTNIIQKLKEHKVHIYQCPTDDPIVAKANQKFNEDMPFAVVGSTEEIKQGGKTIRARQYPWGIVQVENEQHCDFVKLREMFIRTNMEDLRETTHSVHYELYRKTKLSEMGLVDDDKKSLQEAYQEKKREHKQNMERAEENVRENFIRRVKVKESELKEKEKELHDRYEELKKQHSEEKRKLEEDRDRLKAEMEDFNKRKTLGSSKRKK